VACLSEFPVKKPHPTPDYPYGAPIWRKRFHFQRKRDGYFYVVTSRGRNSSSNNNNKKKKKKNNNKYEKRAY
jgi:hypothetical protein